MPTKYRTLSVLQFVKGKGLKLLPSPMNWNIQKWRVSTCISCFIFITPCDCKIFATEYISVSLKTITLALELHCIAEDIRKDIRSRGPLRCSKVKWPAKSSVTRLGSPPGNEAQIGQTCKRVILVDNSNQNSLNNHVFF